MGCNQILDRYIEQLIETSTPQAPAWNIEKIRAGKENTWNYIDGCMIKALIELYEITGEQRYLTFADDYIDFFVQDDGTIKHYNPQEYNLDNVNAGKTLYKLYDLVGKPKYRAAMDTIYRQLETQPRTKEGVFWHKAVYPNQIWLDGMYMAQPFYMQYELSFHNRRACSDSFHMFQVVHDLMRNPLNGLYYHAYDASRKQFWCDPVTGLSANFWLRAEGWFAMALIDTWELMPPSMSAEKDEIRKMFHDLIDAMLPYQDEKTGMWHQVINLPNIAPNYLEESGSAITAASSHCNTSTCSVSSLSVWACWASVTTSTAVAPSTASARPACPSMTGSWRSTTSAWLRAWETPRTARARLITT